MDTRLADPVRIPVIDVECVSFLQWALPRMHLKYERPHRRRRENGLLAIRGSWIPVAVRMRADRG
jgi:hypothetical protein